MLAPTTLPDSHNATSSPASACGVTPCARGGWPDSRPVWTGSCPCQPFSVAGVGGGLDDERHLWPFWFHLIEQCRPSVVFGEQVEAAIKHGWLDLVQSDMEGIGYAFAAAGIPAAGVGAPHIRQRLWFVADTPNERQHGRGASQESNGRNTPRQQPERFCNAYRLADANNLRLEQAPGAGLRTHVEHNAEPLGATGRMDDTDDEGLEGLGLGHQADGGRFGALRPVAEAGESRGLADTAHGAGHGSQSRAVIGLDAQGAGTVQAEHGHTGPTNGFWRNADWLLCRDGKWRPVEPGTFPLAHGAAARVGRLRAYGNAISPYPASEMIAAYLECRP